MANALERFEASPIYQLLTIIALLGSVWLLYRGFTTESASSTGAAPRSVSPGAVVRQSSRVACCNLSEACLGLQIGQRTAPLATDYLCCGTQGTDVFNPATRPTKSPIGNPISVGAFSVATGCNCECDPSTVCQIGIGKNVKVCSAVNVELI